MMSFYETILTPILGVIIAVGMVVFWEKINSFLGRSVQCLGDQVLKLRLGIRPVLYSKTKNKLRYRKGKTDVR